MLLLSAIEAVSGTVLDTEQIERCLAEVMEWHSRFYMHTDQLALAELSTALQRDPRFAEATDLENLDRLATFIRHPKHQYRQALTEYLARPEFTGCGHLRLMLEDPAAYRVRRELVVDSVLSFFRRMWGGSPSPNYVVLTGVHEESAVLVIQMKEKPTGSLFVPAIRWGALGDSTAFVVHEPARHFLRRENLTLLTGSGAIDPLADLDAIEEEMDARADLHLGATSRRLADGLPLFEVDFDAQSHQLRIIPLIGTR